MPTDTTAPPPAPGYADRPVTKAAPWHGLVALDLFFNNLATGLFLAAAVAELVRPEVFAPVARAAYPLALLLLLIDLACLVLDLGDPTRFHHMLRVFKPTSPMSLGTWSLTAFSLPLTAAAAMSLAPLVWPSLDGCATLAWLRKAAVVLGLLPALGSALYKGVLLSTNSQPGWRDARWLGGYLTSSAVLLGAAVMLAIALALGAEAAARLLRAALPVLLLLNLLVLVLLLANVCRALAAAFRPARLAVLTMVGVGLGLVVPLALWGLRPTRDGAWASAVAVPLVLVGAVAVRFALVRLPHAGAYALLPESEKRR